MPTLRRTTIIGLVSAILAACGTREDDGAAVATGEADRSQLLPAMTSTVPDPWVEAVLAAEHPIAVAYGFRDDGDEAARLLLRSWERKYARCMVGLGFKVEPVIDFDPVTDQRNTDWINSQPIERRIEFLPAQQRCADDASRRTYLAAAVGLVGDNSPPLEPERPVTYEEGRQAVITLILENREVLEELIANLEID